MENNRLVNLSLSNADFYEEIRTITFITYNNGYKFG